MCEGDHGAWLGVVLLPALDSTAASRRRIPNRLLAVSFSTFFTFASGAALAAGPALPTGGAFTSGSGSITQSGSQLTILQNGARGIINWQNFSIGQGGLV